MLRERREGKAKRRLCQSLARYIAHQRVYEVSSASTPIAVDRRWAVPTLPAAEWAVHAWEAPFPSPSLRVTHGVAYRVLLLPYFVFFLYQAPRIREASSTRIGDRCEEKTSRSARDDRERSGKGLRARVCVSGGWASVSVRVWRCRKRSYLVKRLRMCDGGCRCRRRKRRGWGRSSACLPRRAQRVGGEEEH